MVAVAELPAFGGEPEVEASGGDKADVGLSGNAVFSLTALRTIQLVRKDSLATPTACKHVASQHSLPELCQLFVNLGLTLCLC